MNPIIKLFFLTTFLLLSLTTTSSAYNREWSSKEDIIYPCPGPRCEKECNNPCGCAPDGTPKDCECKPNTCCLDVPPKDKTSSPVYSKNGAFTWSDTDISLIAKPSLVLRRTYTAFDAHLGLFGNAWISEFEKLFIETVRYTKDNNDIQSSDIYYILRLTNGSRYSYKYDENNNALIDTGKLQVKANKIDEHHTTLTYKNGMVESYEDGYLIEKKDRSGNILTLNYDDTKLLQSVQSGSATLTFTYNSNGFVSQVTDHTDRAWQYNYDEYGNLTGITNPLGGTKTYTYQAYKESFDAQIDYLITDISDEEGRSIVSTTYNSDGRVHSYTEGTLTYTYTYIDANTIKKTDNDGNTFTFIMDNDGFIIKTIDPLGNSTQEIYDEDNRTTTTIDANGNKWVKLQDELGRVIASINPLGNSTTYSYEGNNTRPKSITSPLGHSTSMTYNSNGKPLTVTDANSNTRSFQYDTKGNATEITDAKGNKTTIAYNTNNKPTGVTNALGHTMSITYDNLGRQNSITDAEGKTSTFEYNDMNEMIKTTNAIGNIATYSYDKAGKLIGITDPVGNKTKYIYDKQGRASIEIKPNGKVTTYTYNTDNTIASIVRPDGKVANYKYNKAKHPISQSVDGDSISYTYDNDSNILTATNSNSTISFTYDTSGKLIKETQLGIDIATSYDSENNVKTLKFLNKTVTYLRGNTGLAKSINNINIIYDKNDIRTQLNYPNGTSEENTFDALYNIKKIQTANQTLYYTQDKTGLITSKNSTKEPSNNISTKIRYNTSIIKS